MRIVDEFDVYGSILNYGNRTDVEGYSEDDWYSWDAEEIDYQPDDGFGPMHAAVVHLYNDSGTIRKVLVAWRDIHE